MGLVSLFADMTYEAGRSVTGPYLALLGASATAVGIIAGLGELIGYGLRIFTGIISDRTQRYWLITIIGYAVNVLAVPALALAGHWETAAVLIIVERLGKAIRAPARDAMLSHAACTVGKGWGFAIHEAMDQIGAMLGPMIVAVVLAWKGSYPYAFAALVLPALLAISTLIIAKLIYPQPQKLENVMEEVNQKPFRTVFWLYLVAVGLVAAGFADFPLIAFHVKISRLIPDEWIPLLYSGAMGVDALSALLIGRLYDKIGLPILMIFVGITAPFAPLAFSTNVGALLGGILLWGIGLGAQESVIRAVVIDLVPRNRRATGYGVFNTGFGIAWFIGSAVMGILYDWSLLSLVIFSVALQLASIPLIYMVYLRLGDYHK